MIRQASFASGRPIALETNGTVREARGLASITCRPSSPWIANWTLSSPTTPSARAIPTVCSRICSSICSPSPCGGSTQAESPEWIPASSTCCMIPAIQTSPAPPSRAAVAERIDVDLDRVLEEAVEVDRPALRADPAQVVAQPVDAVDDLHRAAAEHVAWADQQREPDLGRARQRLLARWLAVAYGGAL